MTGEQQIVFAGCTSEHGDADLARDFITHLRESRPRYEDRYLHLRALDDHFGGKTTGGIKRLVAAFHAVEPHLPGDRIDRIMASDVFDEHENLGPFRQRAAVHGTRLLVNRLVAANVVDETVKRRLADRSIMRQCDRLDLIHERAEYSPLAATGGNGALLHTSVEIGNTRAGGYSDRIHFPIHLHRRDIVDAADQPLITQIAYGERLGRGAERHQRDDFAFVDIDG